MNHHKLPSSSKSMKHEINDARITFWVIGRYLDRYQGKVYCTCQDLLYETAFERNPEEALTPAELALFFEDLIENHDFTHSTPSPHHTQAQWMSIAAAL